MPISTKLECAHYGTALKTSTAVPPGAKVRCPRCKGVIHVKSSDEDGLVETIPIEGEAETIELAEPPSVDLGAAIANDGKGAKRGVNEPSVTGPARAQGPMPSAGKKVELTGSQPGFRSGRTVFAGAGIAIAVVVACAFAWWYVGQVKELDVAGDVAVERRTAKIEKAAAAPKLGIPTIKPAAPASAPAAGMLSPPSRTTAPSTAEIGDMVVGVSSARIGPAEQGGMLNSFSVELSITNKSAKPIKYLSWSRSEIAVVLRDRYGNSYRRVSPGSKDEVEIKPGETMTDRLVFEPTAFGSELTLDLPVAGAGKSFLFVVPAGFIERTAAPIAVATKQASTKAVPPPGGFLVAPAVPVAPSAPKAADPATDPKVIEKVRGDFKESMAEINRRRLGMSSNDSVTFQRRERTKLVKKLAKDNELTEDQVKSMVGLRK
jgi:hypothetical protein